MQCCAYFVSTKNFIDVEKFMVDAEFNKVIGVEGGPTVFYMVWNALLFFG